MSTVELDRPATPAREHLLGLRVSGPRVLRSEWIKLRSLRSTRWSLLGATGLVIGFGVLISYLTATQAVPEGGAVPGGGATDGTGLALSGVTFGQLVIGVLAVLAVTGEYTTGTIRSTLAVVPARLTVLWAKTTVVTLVSFVIGLAAAVVAFFLSQLVLSGDAAQTTFGADGVARSVLGAGLYLAVVAVLGVGLGWLIRSTAGAIAALFALLMVLPVLVPLLPASWNEAIGPYLPGTAGQAVMTVAPADDSLGPWTGLAVFAAYALAALATGAVRLVRRDA